MTNLAGLHDRSAAHATPPGTWVVDTIALSENPQPHAYDGSREWFGRLNWGYGSTGTLPLPDRYNVFAQAAAVYVAGSRGCRRWIIGNEPNLAREWPDHVPIYPWNYAAAYKLCRAAIHALPGHSHDEVLIAASGPWNDQCQYDGNPDGDWIKYFSDQCELCGVVDGFSIHAYTHAYDVSQVSSDRFMDHPFENRQYNFRTYQDYCDAVPLSMTHLPAYITEANGDGPWRAVGLIPAMLQEIDSWNETGNSPTIRCCAFYRFSDEDDQARFEMGNKPDVMNEYYAAVALGFEAPASSPGPGPTPEPPQPGPGPTPEPTPPVGDRTIDPELIGRGVKFEFVSPPPGTGYWRVVYAYWLDEDEADAAGPDHHILGTIARQAQEVADVPFKVTWPSGFTTIKSKADQSDIAYNYDFPMSSSLNEFSIWVDDGNPSDKVSGLGMGANGNPSLHTSTWIDWVWTVAEAVTPEPKPPIPVPAHLEYVTAPSGANMRAAPVDGAVLVALPYGAEVTVDGTQQGSDGHPWKHTRYLGSIGWVRGDLLSKTAPTPPRPVVGKLVHPLPGSRITQHFYQDPAAYAVFDLPGHNGTDFGGKPEGTPIACLADGVVAQVGFDKDYGNFVRVAHDALGAYSFYAHMSRRSVDVGQVVPASFPLGLLGSTGNSTGPHLHLEIRLMRPDGSYSPFAPMKQGRCDPETFCAMHNLKL